MRVDKAHLRITNILQRDSFRGKVDLFGLYLAFGDFSYRFFDERGPGREEVFLRVLLQAAVAAAHRAIPRHLQRKTPD